jgi:DNA polymerase/3'-5' exonuclease PolX
MDLTIKLKLSIYTKLMSKEELIRQFQILIHKITADNDKSAPFKIRQYADTIKLLLTYPSESIDEITKVEEWFRLNGKKNPKNIMEKITTFKNSGYIPQVKDAMDDPVVNAVINLTKIANIGPAKAKELYRKHAIITIDDLRKKYLLDTSIIHDKQQMGLKYHNDLSKRIPRDEMESYNKVLGNICKSISTEMLFSINGSFRREHMSSGDVDILISGPPGKNKEFRQRFIDELKSRKIIKEILASGKKKFMGIALLDGYSVHRHVDIIDTELVQYPFAQLYFTGSGGFNSHMRLIALNKGFSINEYCISDKKTKKPVEPGEIFNKLGKDKFEVEEDIFRFIDIDYVYPKDRNTATLSKMI